MKKAIHPVAGMLALATICVFWISTGLSELFGSRETIVAVKTTIPWGFLLLIPAMTATGASGFALAGSNRAGIVSRKIKRSPIIAGNGILILMPAALFLASKAKAGSFDTVFYTVQVVELAAGLLNISLLSLNMRDGVKMSGRVECLTTPSQ